MFRTPEIFIVSVDLIFTAFYPASDHRSNYQDMIVL